TVRPELPSYRSHNVAFSLDQAERLFHDLRAVLTKAGVQSLIVLLVLGFSGCSGKVEVETETTSSRPEAEAEVITTERTRTAVSVDLLRDRGPVLLEDGEPVEVPFDGVLVVEGCVHFHEHLHVYLCEGDRKAERIAVEVVREWTDGECGRMRR
ncbi:MAG: hypothetical protein ACC652_13980, partial [Acidimicrobiales bacterium]